MTALMPQPEFDVAVAGAGPGGLVAADLLARRGRRVVVFEEHRAVGQPVHCTGILAVESFDELDLPSAATLNGLTHVQFVSPAGITVGYSTPAPLAVAIDRGAFDVALARRATVAGVELLTDARVSAVESDAAGVTVSAGRRRVRARLAILACGASYGVQRRLGLGLPQQYLHSAQRELPTRFPGVVELHFGRAVAPDGFAWAVPVCRSGRTFVRVGAMASADAPGCYARMLARLGERWGIEDDGQPPRQKILPLGAIRRTYGERLLAIGDAAGLVKPTTGGGIYYSVLSARIAADVASEALERDRLDAETLSAYERAWQERLSPEFEAQHALRAIASRMSDDQIDGLFHLACTDGIMPIVRRTARFNQHRALIFALFRHPPARRILLRALAG
jgi:digeranylgeranylglycerophospholipid reductase